MIIIDETWVKYSPNFIANLLRQAAFTADMAPEAFARTAEKMIHDIIPRSKATVDAESIAKVLTDVKAGKLLPYDTRSVVAAKSEEFGKAYAYMWAA